MTSEPQPLVIEVVGPAGRFSQAALQSVAQLLINDWIRTEGSIGHGGRDAAATREESREQENHQEMPCVPEPAQQAGAVHELLSGGSVRHPNGKGDRGRANRRRAFSPRTR